MMPDIENKSDTQVPHLHQSSEEVAVARSKSLRKCLVIISLTILVAAAAVIIGICVVDEIESSSSDSREETESSTSSSDSVSDQTPTRFANRKAKIDRVCSRENTMAANGMDSCAEICEPAECCTSNTADSCVDSKTEGCVSYSKCQVVFETKNGIAAAPSNIETVCSKEMLETKNTSCIEACEDVRCCWEDPSTSGKPSCLYDSDFFLTCLDYAPCNNLEGKLPVAPSGLDDACFIDFISDTKTDCGNICEDAKCCIDLDNNCLKDNFVSCLTYAPCGLEILKPFQVFDHPDEDFYDTCKLDNLLDTGTDYEECTALCTEADCCKAKGDENCFPEDPIGCLAYMPCALLDFTGGEVPRAPEDILYRCNLENFQEESGIEECRSICGAAECCFDKDPERNCMDDGDAIACLGYFPCLLLEPFGGELLEPTSQVSQACGGSWDNVVDSTECKDLCSKSVCCTLYVGISDMCFYGNIDTCARWSIDGCWRVWHLL